MASQSNLINRSFYFTAKYLLNDRLFFEKTIQLSRSATIKIGISPISKKICDEFLSFHEVMIITTSTCSITIFRLEKINQLMDQLKSFLDDSQHENIKIVQSYGEVQLSEHEVMHLINIRNWIDEYFEKYKYTETFFYLILNNDSEDLLTDPMGASGNHFRGDGVRELVGEIILNFIDFFKFCFRICLPANFTVVEN